MCRVHGTYSGSSDRLDCGVPAGPTCTSAYGNIAAPDVCDGTPKVGDDKLMTISRESLLSSALVMNEPDGDARPPSAQADYRLPRVLAMLQRPASSRTIEEHGEKHFFSKIAVQRRRHSSFASASSSRLLMLSSASQPAASRRRRETDLWIALVAGRVGQSLRRCRYAEEHRPAVVEGRSDEVVIGDAAFRISDEVHRRCSRRPLRSTTGDRCCRDDQAMKAVA